MLIRFGLSADEIRRLVKDARNGNPSALANVLKSAKDNGIQRITRYTLRHFMATRVRGLVEADVGREQRSLWLGHGKRDATSWYETHDPEFLRECARATCMVIDKLDALTKRDLVPPNIKQMRLLTASRGARDRAA